MDKLFSRKEKVFYSVVFGLSLMIFASAMYRMETCGYDCGLFAISSGPTVVVVYLLSFWTSIIILGVFLLKFLIRKFGKNKT
jgi:type III secretory pathway component EscU